MCLACILLTAIQKLFADHLQRWGFTMQAKEIEVDEDLPPFFESIKITQAEEVLLEEHNMLHNYGFSFNDGDTIGKL